VRILCAAADGRSLALYPSCLRVHSPLAPAFDFPCALVPSENAACAACCGGSFAAAASGVALRRAQLGGGAPDGLAQRNSWPPTDGRGRLKNLLELILIHVSLSACFFFVLQVVGHMLIGNVYVRYVHSY